MHPRIVIPARLDAGRLPGKVLLPIGDKPLLQHVWERGCAAGLGGAPLVATDDERVAAVARGFGAEVFMSAAGHRCGSERVAEAAVGLDAELIINLQADEALIDPAAVAGLPELFADPAVEMATLAAPLIAPEQLTDPAVVKVVVDERGDALYFSRAAIPHPRRGGPPQAPWLGHLGVYAYRRRLLSDIYARPPSALERVEGLEQLRVIEAGRRIRIRICRAAHFGIDTQADLERARTALGQGEAGG